MSDIASRAYLSIDFSGGNFKLKRVKSAKVKFDADTEVILALGVDGGAGFRDKTGGGELTLEVFFEAGDPEVNYWKLWATREKFGMVLQVDAAGLRFQFYTVRVAQPPEMGVDDTGNNMFTATLKFLNFGQI